MVCRLSCWRISPSLKHWQRRLVNRPSSTANPGAHAGRLTMKTRFRYPRRRRILALSLALTLSPAFPRFAQNGARPATRPTSGEESPYLAQNDAAMTRMMKGMAVKPSGDVDRDFVAMMVPHHQGAIDMAVAVLRHGRNEQIRRLAQEIIVTQQEEIASMLRAVGDPLPPSRPSPTRPPEPASAGPTSGRV